MSVYTDQEESDFKRDPVLFLHFVVLMKNTL